jgi:hypothetical protein
MISTPAKMNMEIASSIKMKSLHLEEVPSAVYMEHLLTEMRITERMTTRAARGVTLVI